MTVRYGMTIIPILQKVIERLSDVLKVTQVVLKGPETCTQVSLVLGKCLKKILDEIQHNDFCSEKKSSVETILIMFRKKKFQ